MKLIKTMLVGMVSLALLVGQGQGPPKNHWEGNCGALMSGQSEYWLDSDGDGQPEDGPYAVWNEDADGNPVNCGGGPEWLPFNEVDTDGNGMISRDEARAKYGTDPAGNEVGDFDQRFDEVDVNGSGDVDMGEYDAARNADQGGGGDHDGGGDQGGQQGQQGGQQGQQGGQQHDGQQGQHGGQGGQDGGPPNWTFEDVDTNGDGVISRDEARAKYGTDPMGNPVQDFDQRFDEVDANGSGDVDPAEHAAAQNDQGGDCGFKMGDNGSVMVSLPDGSERWLMAGEYTMNDDGSLTVNKDGEPDNGATITPPPCNDGGGSNN